MKRANGFVRLFEAASLTTAVLVASPSATGQQQRQPPAQQPVAQQPAKAGPLLRNPGPAGLIGGVSGNGSAGVNGGARPSLPAALSGRQRVITGNRVRNAVAENSAIIAVLRQQKQATGSLSEHTLGAGTLSPLLGARAPNLNVKAVASYTPSSLLTPTENAWCQQREAQNLAPVIFRIAGKPKGQGVVYSPGPQANPYHVVGCGFGDTTGSVNFVFMAVDKVVTSGALKIQTWNDHEIVASLDQNTSGLPDWGKVLLLVGAQKTTTVSAEGSFYARRQTIQLPSIPLNQASLYQQGSPYFLSPVSNYYGLNGTVAVMRQGLPGPVAGQDQFTLQLNPGFVVESTQTDLLASNTAANVTSKPASVNGNTITVTYPVVSDSSGTSTNYYYSIYGLKIWVTGPAGVTP